MEKTRRPTKSRLLAEAKRLDPKEEQFFAEEGMIVCRKKLRSPSERVRCHTVKTRALKRGYRAMFAEDRRIAESSVVAFREAILKSLKRVAGKGGVKKVF